MNPTLPPYFPAHIFNGTWSGRPNDYDMYPPTFFDYLKLSKELEATQKFILDNFKNLQAAPDSIRKLQEISEKAENIEKNLGKLATPEQLDSYIEGVECKLNSLIAKVDALQKTLAAIHLKYVDLSDRLTTIEKGWETDVAAFQRYNRGEFARLKEAVEKEIAELREHIKLLKDIFR